MRICPHCKAACSDSDRFCMKCGEPLPEGSNQEGAQIPVYQPPSGYAQYQKEEETISTGKWVLYQLIPLIPVVGWIVYIVMLFVWGFGSSEKNATFRNWAKSNLIIMLVEVVFIILFIALFAAAFASMLSSGEFNSSVFDNSYNSYSW